MNHWKSLSLLCVALIVGMLLVPSFTHSQQQMTPVVTKAGTAESLHAGYHLDVDGNIVETGVNRKSSVFAEIPLFWRSKVLADVELNKFVESQLLLRTRKAHQEGVIGFSDRQAYWTAAISDIRRLLMAKIADKYDLTLSVDRQTAKV